MVNTKEIKQKLDKYKGKDGWYPMYSPHVAYDVIVMCEELVKEVEQLRQDLKELYGVTQHVRISKTE